MYVELTKLTRSTYTYSSFGTGNLHLLAMSALKYTFCVSSKQVFFMLLLGSLRCLPLLIRKFVQLHYKPIGLDHK